MKKLIGLSLVMFCLSHYRAEAQDATDFSRTALELSQFNIGGTSRIQGMGGVGTALGGDASSAFLNPAGLGFYTKSEFSFTPALDFYSTGSLYEGTSMTDSRINFNIANLNILWNHTRNTSGEWHGGSFAININRMASFNQRYSYEGSNETYDFIDYAVESDNGLNGLGRNDFSDLAFNTYLTDEFYTLYEGQSTIMIDGLSYDIADLYGNNLNMGDSLFFIDRNTYRGSDLGFPTEQDPTRQYENIRSKGGMYQTSFAYGGNYGDKVYFGANLGLITVQREVERTYTEEPSNSDLGTMILTDDYNQQGFGINGTFGLMVRPVDQLIVGLSYTTPSWIGITQQREISLSSEFVDGDYFEDGIVYPDFDYSIKTPGRLKGGLSVFLGKQGFISADIEHLNYGNARLSNASEGNFSFDNDLINEYNSTINYRVGGEFRLDIFRFRAGYAHISDPTDDSIDNTQNTLSLGAGVRTTDFFVDVSGTTGLTRKFTVSPYPTATPASINSDISKVAISVGWFF